MGREDIRLGIEAVAGPTWHVSFGREGLREGEIIRVIFNVFQNEYCISLEITGTMGFLYSKL